MRRALSQQIGAPIEALAYCGYQAENQGNIELAWPANPAGVTLYVLFATKGEYGIWNPPGRPMVEEFDEARATNNPDMIRVCYL